MRKRRSFSRSLVPKLCLGTRENERNERKERNAPCSLRRRAGVKGELASRETAVDPGGPRRHSAARFGPHFSSPQGGPSPMRTALLRLLPAAALALPLAALTAVAQDKPTSPRCTPRPGTHAPAIQQAPY